MCKLFCNCNLRTYFRMAVLKYRFEYIWFVFANCERIFAKIFSMNNIENDVTWVRSCEFRILVRDSFKFLFEKLASVFIRDVVFSAWRSSQPPSCSVRLPTVFKCRAWLCHYRLGFTAALLLYEFFVCNVFILCSLRIIYSCLYSTREPFDLIFGWINWLSCECTLAGYK